MKLVFPRNMPQKEKLQATEIFAQYMNKEISARKMIHAKFSVLNVGHRFRIVVRENKAEVMSHETYNKLKFRKQQ